mmetsp:Transcript_11526/g.20408  ORF Transcript_11526/g.20408 Transcript_11526/m.20408 type:complete len:286 (-) Transcript_11526:9-866(-)
MWSTSPCIRCVSIIPVCIILFLFGYEWYAFNMVFVRYGLGRWQGETFLLAKARIFAFNVAWFLALYSYAACCCSDPGFVQKEWTEKHRGKDAKATNISRFGWQPRKHTFCKHCQDTRPERAHHCRACGKCVMRMDHHCPWVGNCVGAKNHKFFILMLLYVMLASVIYVVSAAPLLMQMFSSEHDSTGVRLRVQLGVHGMSMFSMGAVLACAFCLAVGVLGVSHLWLMCVNRTSIEMAFTGTNPYNVDCDSNVEQLCGSMGFDWLLPLDPIWPVTDGSSYPLAEEV